MAKKRFFVSSVNCLVSRKEVRTEEHDIHTTSTVNLQVSVNSVSLVLGYGIHRSHAEVMFVNKHVGAQATCKCQRE